MLLSDRRFFCLGLLTVAGCGFKPLYRQGEGASELVGDIALQEATDPDTFAFRERMRRRIGHNSDSATQVLQWQIRFDETGVAITPTADITRYQIEATAVYRLIDRASGQTVQEGLVKTSGAYDATAEAFASRSAARDERSRIAIQLAELTATRLLATASTQ